MNNDEAESKPIAKPHPVIYLVDDDNAMRSALSLLMTTVGYQPIGFSRPSEFLNAVDPDVPGCVVLDVRLSGLEV
jgi:FixJ family two-component response regulator